MNTNASAMEIECVDQEKLNEFIESDAELYAEMVALLIQEYPRRLTQISAAIEQGDGKTLERGAHSLKGSLSYFCSKTVIERLQRLENLGRTMEFATAAPLCGELTALFPRLKNELQARITTAVQVA